MADLDTERLFGEMSEVLRSNPDVVAWYAREYLVPGGRPELAPMTGEVSATLTMRLEALETLWRVGRLESDAALSHPAWRQAYGFMVEAMGSAGVSQPSSGTPWWTWTDFAFDELWCDSSCGGGMPLCDRRHIEPGFVLAEFVIPGERMLASSFARWDFGAIRGFYLPASNQDGAHFGMLLDLLGQANVSGMTSAAWPEPLREIARSSWPRVFEMTAIPGRELPPVGARKGRPTLDELQMSYAGVPIIEQAVVAELDIAECSKIAIGPVLEEDERRAWWAVNDDLRGPTGDPATRESRLSLDEIRLSRAGQTDGWTD